MEVDRQTYQTNTLHFDDQAVAGSRTEADIKLATKQPRENTPARTSTLLSSEFPSEADQLIFQRKMSININNQIETFH